MLTKRAAIIAIFSGVLAKMAHADDPNWKPLTNNEATASGVMALLNGQTTWTVNLDAMKQLDVQLGDQKATITPAEIFAALKS